MGFQYEVTNSKVQMIQNTETNWDDTKNVVKRIGVFNKFNFLASFVLFIYIRE